MKKTYAGSCHCKAVRFEADLDLEEGTGKCNCTYCWKQRMWNVGTSPENFRLLSGEEFLGEFRVAFIERRLVGCAAKEEDTRSGSVERERKRHH